MRKLLLFMGFFLFSFITWGQERTVSGKVTSLDDGSSLPGVNVILKGTSTGTVTDVDGNYSLSVPSEGGTLIFSFVGLSTQEVEVGSRSVIDVQMATDVKQLSEVVVTALGIERDKRSLGYAVQEVSGDEVSTAKEASFISSLSGKVAGVNVGKSNSLGGSVNVLVRGSSSFTKNNQALFVVDGIPISNANLNTTAQQRGGGGYDYGNAASDIDPESIASITVLKGASAAALYGSDAANGVVLITTKKGNKAKGIGVTLNHTTSFSKVDMETFPEYQKEYGAGYGPYYSGGSHPGLYEYDFDGDGDDDLVVPAGEDASFGEKFDEDLLVYQWDSFYPQLGSFGEAKPWKAAENGPESVFRTGVSDITSVSFAGGGENGSFRLGYTRDDRFGILPNSHITRNTVDFNASYKLTDKLTVDGKVTYTRNEGQGRYGTGYDAGNIMQSLKQWFQVNVDLEAQKNAYLQTGDNITWNPNSENDLTPHYFDNPYWVLYENYETDKRNRMFGKFQAQYEITDWLSAMARFGVDNTSDLQEERIAIGSLDQSEYSKYQRTYEQYTSDFILKYDKNLSDQFSLTGLLGAHIFNAKTISTFAQTNGGLVVERFYSLSNSVSALEPPTEYEAHKRKYRYYGQATLGYNDYLYLDAIVTRESSSTLPEGENVYWYSGYSMNFLFSELLDFNWLNLAKVRASYGSVGNDADPYQVYNTFAAATPFGSTPLYYVEDASQNPDLKPELTTEIELGLEADLLDNRAGFNITWYKRNTTDQLFSVQVPSATGFNSKFVNAGEMENKGIELSMYGSPIRTNDFEWRVDLNWAKNENQVISLYGDSENRLIYSQWSTAINARKGQPYGTITGTNYVFHDNGKRIVGADGKYLASESTTEVIGNIQPDWIGGINNRLSYKNLSLSFLVDMQKGGDVVSWDMAFGQATGLYATTAGNNELGNPQRDPVSEGGGILLDGVMADGSVNTTRADASTYEHPYGYYGGSSETGGNSPDAQNVYDASYVKLREVTLSYTLPARFFENIFVRNVTVGAFGRNLWIIDKNLPYGDPEYNASSGNIRGIQNAALPSTKEFGFNVSVQF